MEKILIISNPKEVKLLKSREGPHTEIKIQIQTEANRKIKYQKVPQRFKYQKIKIIFKLQKINLFLN
jgi:hypothetical protein